LVSSLDLPLTLPAHGFEWAERAPPSSPIRRAMPLASRPS
jgi:hypothetical protein